MPRRDSLLLLSYFLVGCVAADPIVAGLHGDDGDSDAKIVGGDQGGDTGGDIGSDPGGDPGDVGGDPGGDPGDIGGDPGGGDPSGGDPGDIGGDPGGGDPGGGDPGGGDPGGGDPGGGDPGGGDPGGGDPGGGDPGGGDPGGGDTCSNQIQDGDESAVDCGGSCPTRCSLGLHCNDSSDCASGYCAATQCATKPSCPRVADPTAPVVFFTDLVSGPATGGLDNLGVFVTLYGLRFGATRGSSTVTIHGQEVARYVSWSGAGGPRGTGTVVVQLGPSAVSGDLVVTVGGRASNPIPFTVRPGSIYFVSKDAAGASDSNAGTDVSLPLATLYGARASAHPGDVVYIKGGTYDDHDPLDVSRKTNFILSPVLTGIADGTQDLPVAYVGYPGARPTIGGTSVTTDTKYGIAVTTEGATPAVSYYVLAELNFGSAETPLWLQGAGHRVIGNRGMGLMVADGVLMVGPDAASVAVWGNNVSGNSGTTGMFAGIVVQGGGVSKIDVGWNESSNNHADGINVGLDTSDTGIDNVAVHDNLMVRNDNHNIRVAGTLGSVDIFNNIMVYASTGVQGEGPMANVTLRHNTMYNNYWTQFNLNATGVIFTVENNILGSGGSESYNLGYTGSIIAQQNLYAGADPVPSWDALSPSGSAQFVGTSDYHVSATSPAVDAAAALDMCADYDGVSRPQGAGYDIGAYER